MSSHRTTVVAGLVLVSLVLAFGAVYVGAEELFPSGHCPLCGTKGVSIPEKDELSHCECEKWWHGKNVSRIVVGDCSDRYCPGIEEPELVFVDLPMYRCPKDGLLFTVHE